MHLSGVDGNGVVAAGDSVKTKSVHADDLHVPRCAPILFSCPVSPVDFVEAYTTCLSKDCLQAAGHCKIKALIKFNTVWAKSKYWETRNVS